MGLWIFPAFPTFIYSYQVGLAKPFVFSETTGRDALAGDAMILKEGLMTTLETLEKAGIAYRIGESRFYRVSDLSRIAGRTRQALHYRIAAKGITPVNIGKLFLLEEEDAVTVLSA